MQLESRDDQWSAQTAVEGHKKVVRLVASMAEHRLKWGIVAWVVGTATAAAVAMFAR